MSTVLVVDDNAVDRELIRRQLGRGYDVVEVETARAALAALADGMVGCIVLDYRLPDLDGLEMLERLPSERPPVVLLTGQGGEEIAVAAMKRGADDYLVKGRIDAPALRKAIDNAVDKARLRRELARRDAHLRMIVDHLPVSVWTTDLELRVTTRLGASRNAIGAEGPIAHDAHLRALTGQAVDYELAGATVLQCRVEPLRGPDGRVAGLLGVALDVTETRRLAEQLRHAQKMDALGRLAGGVAHDFNNILTAILGYADVLALTLAGHDDLLVDVDGIRASAWRASGLARQLLAFCRQRAAHDEVVDARAQVEALAPMLERLLGDAVRLRLDLRGEWSVRVGDGGLEQVLVNLVVNARDAMPRGGEIRVRVEDRVVDAPIVVGERGTIAPGAYVAIAVTDRGCGIPPELHERIFEPFFTTKDVGKGTGLGLATCYGIVRHAGGEIVVRSAPGEGAELEVFLPRVVEAPTRRGEAPAAATRPVSGRVLVVEDDPAVRALVVRALRGTGVDAVAFGTPREALAWCRTGDAPRLLVTDLMLPEMDGFELARAVRGQHPRVGLLFMSGHLPEGTEAAQLTGAVVLEKPFTPTELLSRIADALSRPA